MINSYLGSAIPTSIMQENIGDQASSAFRYAYELIGTHSHVQYSMILSICIHFT